MLVWLQGCLLWNANASQDACNAISYAEVHTPYCIRPLPNMQVSGIRDAYQHGDAEVKCKDFTAYLDLHCNQLLPAVMLFSCLLCAKHVIFREVPHANSLCVCVHAMQASRLLHDLRANEPHEEAHSDYGEYLKVRMHSVNARKCKIVGHVPALFISILCDVRR
jgi:hypothetical protein